MKSRIKWLVSKETLCCVGGQVKQLVDYQLEVDKGKLTAVANLTVRRLIYLYQLQVDNQLVMKSRSCDRSTKKHIFAHFSPNPPGGIRSESHYFNVLPRRPAR